MELPRDGSSDELLRYLSEAAALDPEPSPLAASVEALKAGLALEPAAADPEDDDDDDD